MHLDRRLLQLIALVKAPLGLAVLAGLLGGLAAAAQSRQLSRIIAGVFLDGLNLPGAMPLLWLLLAILLLRVALTYLGEVSANLAAQRVKTSLRERLAAHLLALGPAYSQAERSGEILNTITQGIDALDAYYSQYLPQLALAGLLPLAYLILVFPLDPLSGLVLLLTGPLIPFFMFLIGSLSESLTRRQWSTLGRMSAYFLDTLQGLTTLKALGRSQAQVERIAQVSEQYRDATMGVLRVTFLSALVLELLGTIGTAIIAVEIGLRLLYGNMAFEPAFFILLLAPDYYLPLRSLGLRFHASMSGAAAAKRIFAILEEPLPVIHHGHPAQTAPRVSLGEPFEIRLENVTYTYPAREQPSLDGVTLSILSGQVTALVGPSGAGKSTLAGLVLRSIQPQQGALRVNGIPLEDISIDDWRAQLAWVPQQPYLFRGTLADNLRLARPQATETEMLAAAGQAHLLEWIERLPRGLDTPVGEGGAKISGGQAQRLALARAFLRDAPLLVLDEPTAHLDVEQEQLLQESIHRLCAGRTVLVIAHRLPTVAQASQIMVMQSGRVVEAGSHAPLLAQDGLYARLLADYQGRTA